jgi:hypothetical protein
MPEFRLNSSFHAGLKNISGSTYQVPQAKKKPAGAGFFLLR